MTREEKLEAIEDMGIDINADCPNAYFIRDGVTDEVCINNQNYEVCSTCWINALEQSS